MITCGQCHAVLFIDMDGQVQVSGEAPSAEADANVVSESGLDLMASLPQIDAIFQNSNLEPAQSEAARSEAAPFEVTVEPPAPMPPPPPPQRAPVRPPSKSHQAPVPPAQPPAKPTANPSSEGGYEVLQSGNFDEVSQFGNTIQDFGALSYFVLIENIDTSAAREKLFEALSDDKFQWDPREVILQIKKGRLELPQLNPVKASVLVKRLQDVPVKVSWIQKLL